MVTLNNVGAKVELYICSSVSKTIQKVVIATGEVTTIAGSNGVSASTDGTGTAARFLGPYEITNDGTNLYITDGHSVRKMVISSGVVTTLAGSAGTSGSVDGIGNAARFSSTFGITTDGTNLYVGDMGNRTIRTVSYTHLTLPTKRIV